MARAMLAGMSLLCKAAAGGKYMMGVSNEHYLSEACESPQLQVNMSW